jgi:RHS repeat-associated protein
MSTIALALSAAGSAWAIGPEQPGALSATTLKLPSGPGSVRGLSDDAQPALFTGEVQYSVPIELPGAIRGFRPSLDLKYSGELGNGPLGIGWSIGIPQVRRSLRLGVPSYTASDEVELVGIAGGGRLVALPDGSYRVEGKGNAVKVEQSGAGVLMSYVVHDAAGVVYRFGSTGTSRQAGSLGTQAWLLDTVTDLAGQQIFFRYTRVDKELYLSSILWGPNQIYRANLTYESRGDVVVSFRRGYRVATGQRLRRIDVTKAGAPLRSYQLAYDQSFPVSRLASVTQLGSDGTTALPTLSFSYGQPQSPTLLTVAGAAGWRMGSDVSFLDVDGDGVSDLVHLASGQHEYRRNIGAAFAAARPISGAAQLNLNRARLMDVYGDARPELVSSSGDSWNVYRLVGEEWVLAESYPGTLNIPLIAQFAADLDLNGDGRTDVLRAAGGGLTWFRNDSYRDAAGVDHLKMTQVNLGPIAGDATLFPDAPGVRFFDVNGDGLDDVVRMSDSGIVSYLGHGDGTFEAGASTPYPWGSGTIAYDKLLLCDLNRDGLMDLVRVSDGDVQWYRGLVGGQLSASAQRIARPESADLDVVVSISDVNGNGSQDVVWSSPRGMWALDLAGPTTAGMLTRIDNGLGKSTSFDYDASAVLEFRDELANASWLQKLPISIPVVVGRHVDPGAGLPVRASLFAVRDGFWDYSERRFGGFATTSTIDPEVAGGDARSEVTTHHLGLGADRALRGRPVTIKTYRNGQLHQLVTNRWLAALVDGIPDVPLGRKAILKRTTQDSYEGLAAGTSIESATEYDYDGEGRISEERRLGRLDLAGDELTIRRSYASDAIAWVRDLLVEESRWSGDGQTVLSDRKLLYGDDTKVQPFGQTGKGWLREVDELLSYGSDNRWVATRQLSYDALGQTIAELSDGVLRHLGYDALDLHPVSESIDAQPGTRLTWTAAWDATLDQPTDITDPAGETTHITYDPLGRVRSLGLAGQPAHTVYTYAWNAPAPRTYVYQFDGQADALSPFASWQKGSGWRETVSVSDGAGEALFEATRLDDNSFIVKGLRQLDARGRVSAVAEPFSAASIDGAIAPPAGAGLQTIAYDALDRPTLQTLPLGGARRHDYAAFSDVETVTDRAPVRRQLDGLGRVFHTERTVDGQSEQIDATYDGESRIVALSLQAGVAQHRFVYDTLGRLRSGSDPDAGARSYDYDDGNRLITKTNGAGQSVRFTWDGAGRPLTSTDVTGKSYVYHYDTARVAMATNTAGRLAWVEEPTGSVDFAYDAQGRQSWMRRTVNGSAAEKTVSYSPSGLIRSLQWDDGVSVKTTYDDAGRPTQVGDLWSATSLDAAGRVLAERYGNGVRQLYDRDLLGSTTRIQVLPPVGAALYDVTLARSTMGVLQSVTDNDHVGLDQSAVFSFDGASRLTRAQLGGATASFGFSYAYDPLQNMTSRLADAGRNGGVLTGAYRYGEGGAGPRQLTSILAADGSVTQYAYDGAGRQTQNADLTLAYDGFDQLAAVTRAGQKVADYGYGYDGQRIFERSGAGVVQLWYTEDLVERNGARQHYVRIGGRTLARVDTAVTAAAAQTQGARRALVEVVALLLLLLPLGAGRARRRRWLQATASLTLFAFFAGCVGARHDHKLRANLATASNVLYFHQGVGAGPVIFTGGDGTLSEERRFEPFGQPLDAARPGVAAAAVDFQLDPTNALDKETDAATGFSYHGARWLDPRTARWTEPDPPTKAPDAKFMLAPWKLNPYQYVDQNPIVFWDPDGREPTAEENMTRAVGYSPNPSMAKGSSEPNSSTASTSTASTSTASAQTATVSAATSTTAPAQSSTPKVEMCKREADIPGKSIHHQEHWWLRTAEWERGMGPANGAVPGHGGSDSPYVSQTSINDHKGEGNGPGAYCQPVGDIDDRWSQVDRECLNREMALGRDTGTWTLYNQCHTAVSDALEACSRSSDPGPQPEGGLPPGGAPTHADDQLDAGAP